MLAATQMAPVRALVPLLAALLLVLQAAPTHSQSVQSQSTFSGAAAKQQVDALAGQIGSRPAGSANYDQAVQYAADQLRSWGYRPSLQSFPLQTYDDRGSQLELTSPSAPADGNSAPFAADTLQYSAAGQLEAPLVSGGLGQPEDLTGAGAPDVHGKIVLLKRGALR